MAYLASGFSNVDAADTIQKFTDCLKLLNSLEFFQNYQDLRTWHSYRILKARRIAAYTPHVISGL